MAVVELTFACGHVVPFDEKRGAVCDCGETRVATVKAPPPRIVGVASGPFVTRRKLKAKFVNLAPGGPLRLKESDRG